MGGDYSIFGGDYSLSFLLSLLSSTNRQKVALGDVLEKDGDETEVEFVQEYGKDHVFFQKCDVTSDEQIKVSLTFLFSTFIIISGGNCKLVSITHLV